MAEEPKAVPVKEGEDDPSVITPGYVPPKQATLDEIKNLDADDESLVKYKQTLLAGSENVKDEGGANVLVKALALAPVGRDEIVLDLTGDLTHFKDKPIIIKEGCQYRVKIRFRVQREIVAGMRYSQSTYRKGIRMDHSNVMVGSYGPKTEEQVFQTQVEDTPSGIISRGHYTIKSKFIDDDKNVLLEWEWGLDIKKDWA